jgi:antitoxin ParD1/3/4
VQKPEKNKDIVSVRRQAAEGGLRFEAYLPPGLAEWVVHLVEQGVFLSPSEAVYVAMQSFQEWDEHPDVKQELLKRAVQKGIDSAEQSDVISGEEFMARLRKELQGPRPEPAVWDPSLDRPLIPDN